VLLECERNGIAFLPWSPLSAGSDAARVINNGAITKVGALHHATPAQVALAWLLARTPVMLPGSAGNPAARSSSALAPPLPDQISSGVREAGKLAVELLETRHVRNALKTMPVKTDRNDARGIAQLMRLGWFRPVHCKSMEAQETRALLTARRLVKSKLHDVEMSLRGILRGFGLKVGRTGKTEFEARIRELVAGHPTLQAIAEPLLTVRGVLRRELGGFEKRVRAMARCDPRARLLMTTPGGRASAP
jgi:hypothetical protein